MSTPTAAWVSPDVQAAVEELSDRALLVRIYAELLRLGDRMTAVEDALAAANAALAQLRIDVAAEIQQVIDGLAATADIQTALSGLAAITAGLTEVSAALVADDVTP